MATLVIGRTYWCDFDDGKRKVSLTKRVPPKKAKVMDFHGRGSLYKTVPTSKLSPVSKEVAR